MKKEGTSDGLEIGAKKNKIGARKKYYLRNKSIDKSVK